MNAGHPSIASSDRTLRRRAPRTRRHGGMKTGPLRWRALFLAVVLLPGAAWGEQTAHEILKERRDHELWKDGGGCPGAERYLNAFPEGLHAGEARECLEAGQAERQVERLLEECEAHLAAGRLSTASRGGNAVDCYGEVLSLDRGNRDALSGLDRVMEEYGRRVRQALEGGRLERARGFLEKMAELNAESIEVMDLEEAIARAERDARDAAERKRADDDAFASARSEGTVSALDGYLASCGLCGHRAEARRLRAVAERKAKEAEEAARRARAEAESKRKAREAEERRKRARRPGYTFEDCPECPKMVVVPGGQFGRPFAVGVYEVTFGEWDACVSGGGCGGYRPHDEGWGRGRRPVVNVSWHDAQAYVRWLSGRTWEEYRLLSEAEWEYVARAGTTTEYWWGNDIGRGRANCAGDLCGDSYRYTAPVGSFSASPFGLHDVHGNVWEWVEDCFEGNCSSRVLRGGSWGNRPGNLRSADRYRYFTGYRGNGVGFRVARTLTP